MGAVEGRGDCIALGFCPELSPDIPGKIPASILIGSRKALDKSFALVNKLIMVWRRVHIIHHLHRMIPQEFIGLWAASALPFFKA